MSDVSSSTTNINVSLDTSANTMTVVVSQLANTSNTSNTSNVASGLTNVSRDALSQAGGSVTLTFTGVNISEPSQLSGIGSDQLTGQQALDVLNDFQSTGMQFSSLTITTGSGQSMRFEQTDGTGGSQGSANTSNTTTTTETTGGYGTSFNYGELLGEIDQLINDETQNQALEYQAVSTGQVAMMGTYEDAYSSAIDAADETRTAAYISGGFDMASGFAGGSSSYGGIFSGLGSIISANFTYQASVDSAESTLLNNMGSSESSMNQSLVTTTTNTQSVIGDLRDDVTTMNQAMKNSIMS